MKHIPIQTAIVVAVVYMLLAALAWRGVPGTAIALISMVTTLITGLMQGMKSEPDIVREYSMRPPPAGPTETYEVRVPSYLPPVIKDKE
jgi:hypothetical protein